MPNYWKEKGDNPYNFGERKEIKGINLQGKKNEGREAQEEGDKRIIMADLCWCSAETQHCKAIFLRIKNTF